MDETLQERFNAEFTEMAKSKIKFTITLTALQVWVVFSNLQLALRHPENTGPSRQICIDVARELQVLVAVSPAMRTVAELGWADGKVRKKYGHRKSS